MTATATRSHRQLALAFIRNIRSPEWGLTGQLLRFALSGGVVALLYVSVTTLLHDAFAVTFQIALAIGFCTSVALHFALQRAFVWRHHEQFALAAHHQAFRYLLVCGSQYAVTAVASAKLPALVGLPVELVYILTMLTIAAFNFIVFRGRIFHSTAPPKRDAMS